jgi:hypothetical protein
MSTHVTPLFYTSFKGDVLSLYYADYNDPSFDSNPNRWCLLGSVRVSAKIREIFDFVDVTNILDNAVDEFPSSKKRIGFYVASLIIKALLSRSVKEPSEMRAFLSDIGALSHTHRVDYLHVLHLISKQLHHSKFTLNGRSVTSQRPNVEVVNHVGS